MEKWSEYKRSGEFKPFEEVFRSILRAYNLEKKFTEQEVMASWEEMMGKGVASRTENLRIDNNILYVKLNSSVMREELNFGKKVIIQRVNEKAGFQLILDVWLE